MTIILRRQSGLLYNVLANQINSSIAHGRRGIGKSILQGLLDEWLLVSHCAAQPGAGLTIASTSGSTTIIALSARSAFDRRATTVESIEAPIALRMGSKADCKDRPLASEIDALRAYSAWRGSLVVS
jgi:hypothetical protein